jgi:hypothetical protein
LLFIFSFFYVYTCSSENNDEEVNEEEEEEQEEHDDNEEDAEENKEDEEEGRGSAGKSVKRAVEGERFFSSLRVRADANGSLAGPPVCLTLSAKHGEALSLPFCDETVNGSEHASHSQVHRPFRHKKGERETI